MALAPFSILSFLFNRGNLSELGVGGGSALAATLTLLHSLTNLDIRQTNPPISISHADFIVVYRILIQYLVLLTFSKMIRAKTK